MDKKVAFITGITGQDGSYLAEFLLSKGYEVHGLVRRSSSFNTGRLSHIFQDLQAEQKSLFLHYGDITDGLALARLIHEIQPSEIYNLAAQSHVKVSFSLAHFTTQVDALGTLSILEIIKNCGFPVRFYQASTSEMFGSTPPPQREDSAFRPRSPYAAAKLMAYWSTVNYREAFGLHASNGILFNHESPRRGETFVTRKITRGVAAISRGQQQKLYLGNLSSIRDWGYAPEYVEAMWLMLQQENPSDYVIATGKGASVQDFVSASFAHVGLAWEKYVEIDNRYYRPTEVDSLIGNPEKAHELLNWRARTDWKALAGIMVEADLK